MNATTLRQPPPQGQQPTRDDRVLRKLRAAALRQQHDEIVGRMPGRRVDADEDLGHATTGEDYEDPAS